MKPDKSTFRIFFVDPQLFEILQETPFYLNEILESLQKQENILT